MSEPLIKVGFCAAYDWNLLKKSVPRVYGSADIICISIDKRRISWSGQPYEIDEADFRDWIDKIDADKKIKIYEDDFSIPNFSSMENDNRQRTLMAKFLGVGGWHIQIDSDEYFIDFEGFCKYLLKINPHPTGQEKPINICCNWISLIKQTESGYLFVDNSDYAIETMPFATNCPDYQNARRNGHFNHMSPFFVLHETWARGEEQLWQKLNSWSHDSDFDKESYFNLWKILDEHNYKYLRDFHPVQSQVWHALAFSSGDNIEELIEHLTVKKRLELPADYWKFDNSRNWQRIKSLLSKIK